MAGERIPETGQRITETDTDVILYSVQCPMQCIGQTITYFNTISNQYWLTSQVR